MKILTWFVLCTLFGNPFVALFAVIVLYWLLDRWTLGILPDPFRIVGRYRRLWRLDAQLEANSHDRKARFDRAETLLELRRPKAAFAAIRPNVEAGDHDPHTLFLAGRAAFAAGEFAVGRKLLEAVRKDEPSFAQNRLDLELGRGLLQGGEAEAAQEALERFVGAREASIEGHVLLSRARAARGDSEGAQAARAVAWKNYTAAPRFVRRTERWWAWRANPVRPVLWGSLAAVGLMGLFVAATVF
ncbi:MAG: hypothetical protein AAFZ18_02995 [Myxococcota bacterium]